MDVRDSPEQAELRRSARQLARELGPGTVAGLDDGARRARLTAAASDAGWLELRDDGGGGASLAGGSEASIIAEALGEAVADTPFTGPVLARDLLRRAGASADEAAVAFAADLTGAAITDGAATSDAVHVLDAATTARHALVLVPASGGFRLGHVTVGAPVRGTDLTRAVCTIPPGTPVETIAGELTRDALDLWTALGLALTSADLVGVMCGV